MSITWTHFTFSLLIKLLTITALLECAAEPCHVVWKRILFTFYACLSINIEVLSWSIAISVLALVPIVWREVIWKTLLAGSIHHHIFSLSVTNIRNAFSEVWSWPRVDRTRDALTLWINDAKVLSTLGSFFVWVEEIITSLALSIYIHNLVLSIAIYLDTTFTLKVWIWVWETIWASSI
jgi:hypothetical protein